MLKAPVLEGVEDNSMYNNHEDGRHVLTINNWPKPSGHWPKNFIIYKFNWYFIFFIQVFWRSWKIYSKLIYTVTLYNL